MWGFVLCTNILYRHAHRLPNGRIVSHIHPYKWTGEKGPFQSNPHSASDLSWLDAHSNQLYCSDLPAPFQMAAVVLPEECLTSIRVFDFDAYRVVPDSPRGPPARLS
ncbi:hypothetical protein GCM10023091_04740 [Ravibacter arvi]|uniref:Uncharacterized protein n=2 Tax=Ravibacter arvi TaxID=2051041 RepID=A0ABP8LQB8_9BACT